MRPGRPMGERKCGSQGKEGLGRGRLDPEDGQVGGEAAADEAGAPETMGKPRGNLGLSMGLLTRVAGSKGWPGGPPLPGLASAPEPPSRPSSESSTLTSSSGSTSASPSSSHSSRSRSVRLLPWRLVAAEAAAPGLLDLWLAWSSFSVLTWSW